MKKLTYLKLFFFLFAFLLNISQVTFGQIVLRTTGTPITQDQSTIQVNQPYGQGTINQRLMRLTVRTEGSGTPLNISQVNLTLIGHEQIARLAFYSADQSLPVLSNTPYGEIVNPSAVESLTLTDANITRTGDIHFLVVIDVKPEALLNTALDVECTSIIIGGTTYTIPAMATNRNAVVVAPLSGIKTVGSTGDYTNVISLFQELNNLGLGAGGVEFVFKDDETIPIGGTFADYITYYRQGADINRPLIFRRSGDGAKRPTLAVNATGSSDAGLVFTGTDYVTIDGLHIKNVNNQTNGHGIEYGILFSGTKTDGSNNIVVKNCKIDLGNQLTRSRNYGVRFSSHAQSPDAINSNIKIYNNEMMNCASGVSFNFIGSTALFADEEIEIYDNTLTGYMSMEATTAAIHLQGAGNVKIYNNLIDGVDANIAASGSAVAGIRITKSNNVEPQGTVSVYNNIIRNLSNYAVDGQVEGIGVYAPTVYIYNNMISNLNAPNATSGASNGISLPTNNTVSPVYHVWNNSVYLDIASPTPATGGHRTVALNVNGNQAISIASLANNILVNTSTGGVANYVIYSQWRGSGIITTSESDNNLYWPEGDDFIFYQNAKFSTFADYLANTTITFDKNAVSELPPFTSKSDLHIQSGTATIVEGNGKPITVVTTDIDGDSRHTLQPDIGADEGSFTPINIAPKMVKPEEFSTILNNPVEHIVNLSGITNSNPTVNQTINISAQSSNTSVIPHPAIEYTPRSTTGVLKFTPTGTGKGKIVITITLQDNGGTENGGEDTSVYTFIVPVIDPSYNNPPTINLIENLSLMSNASSQTIQLSGISDGDPHLEQNITITASISPTDVISNPVINYTPNQSTGTLSFSPQRSGEATVTVTVTDDGSNEGENENTTTMIFLVTVERYVSNDPDCPFTEDNYWHKTEETPRLPMGINLSGQNYYNTELAFTDVMKTSNFRYGWATLPEDGSIPINPETGYPTAIPFEGQNETVRFLINGNYTGRHVFLYEGEGKLKPSRTHQFVDGKLYMDMPGVSGHVWVDILESNPENPIRNIRIVPEQYSDGSPFPTFTPEFLTTLKPFHALRFMDWAKTNNSKLQHWSDRPTPNYRNQSDKGGVALEHLIELCNELNVDGWFCIPHRASDDFIINYAQMVKEKLKPGLKAYFEYSNEVWNWMFTQANWILGNAPGATDQYVIDALTAINPNAGDHPEKDAYMMSRLFKLLHDVFPEGAERERIVKVAAVQHGWAGNTPRVLRFLRDKGFRIMPDMVSPAGYFGFNGDDHNVWVEMNPTDVTAEMIMESIMNKYPNSEYVFSCKTANYANEFDVGYVTYEGGQHAQPYKQGVWDYNHAVFDAQIHPKMFDMYMTNFKTHVNPHVNCRLFVAFAHMGQRESRYGSWGHLEGGPDMARWLDMDEVIQYAPKYNALLYSAEQKADSLRMPTAQFRDLGDGSVEVTLSTASPDGIIYYSIDGKYPFTERYTTPITVQPGEYVYGITGQAGYAYSRTAKILVKSPITTLSLSNENKLNIYPNPTRDIVNIDFTKNTKGTITVYSLAGTSLLQQDVDTNSIQLDLSSLPKGLYIIDVVAENESFKQKIRLY